jgi:hypothetical protein
MATQFDETVALDRFDKQGARCALCGKRLERTARDKAVRGSWHAHHLDKDKSNNTLDNCAVVCITPPENCHLKKAHGGDYEAGALMDRKAFKTGGWASYELREIGRV